MSTSHLEHDPGTERPRGSSLPTPSTLITSIISSLPSAPSFSPSTATNPLHNAPPSLRSLLTTLHILFPSLLLPALDLLDRHLITKLVLLENPTFSTQQDAPPPSTASPSIPHIVSPQAPTHLTVSSPSAATGPPEIGGAAVGEPSAESAAPTTANARVSGEEAPDAETHGQNTLYLVRSSQASRSRTHAERYYTVRLHAWNCSCAAFVFSAFPGSLSSATATEWWEADMPRYDNGHLGVEKPEEAGDEEGWNFGGVSTDGRDGSAVPCCKHLLACVLADRCAGWLNGFVKERRVGREEMAGLACEG